MVLSIELCNILDRLISISDFPNLIKIFIYVHGGKGQVRSYHGFDDCISHIGTSTQDPVNPQDRLRIVFR